MDAGDEADAVPIEQARAEESRGGGGGGMAGDQQQTRKRIHDNVAYEPAVHHHAYIEDEPVQYTPMTAWETYKYTCLVAAIALFVAIAMSKWGASLNHDNQWMLRFALAFIAGWGFHQICPML